MTPVRRLRALRILGRALVAADECPARGDPSWRDVKIIAAEHGLLGSLHDALPNDADVTAAHRQAMARNLIARRQLGDLVEALHDANVEVLLFKGSQYLMDGTVTDLGTRAMADLDVAVRAADTGPAAVVLGRLGYDAPPMQPFDARHETLYVGPPGAVVPIELHVELGDPPIPQVVGIQDAWARAVELDVNGTRARGLSAEDALVHHVLHTQVQDFNHSVAGLSVRQLHTFVLLTNRNGVPWETVNARLERAGYGAAWRAYAALAEHVFGVRVPIAHLDRPRARVDRGLAMASFAAGEWPSDLVRNLRQAFAADYMDATYELGGDRRRLPAARIRHAWRLVRASSRDTVVAAMKPKR